ESTREAEDRVERAPGGGREGGVARLPESFGDQGVRQRQRVAAVGAVVVREQPGEQGRVRRHRPRSRRNRTVESGAAPGGPAIDPRRGRTRVAVEREMVGAERVDRDQEDVRRRRPPCRRCPYYRVG